MLLLAWLAITNIILANYLRTYVHVCCCLFSDEDAVSEHIDRWVECTNCGKFRRIFMHDLPTTDARLRKIKEIEFNAHWYVGLVDWFDGGVNMLRILHYSTPSSVSHGQ